MGQACDLTRFLTFVLATLVLNLMHGSGIIRSPRAGMQCGT